MAYIIVTCRECRQPFNLGGRKFIRVCPDCRAALVARIKASIEEGRKHLPR